MTKATTTVRGVFSGDWHFSNKLPMAVDTFAGVTDRLRHVESVFRAMIDDAVAFKARFIAILGDIFDKSRPDPVSLKLVVDLMVEAAERGLEVFVLPGNHDGDLRGAYFFATEALGAMRHPRVSHLERGRTVDLAPWLQLEPVPFAPLGSTLETLAELAGDLPPEGVQRIGLLHHPIVGATHYGYTVPDEHGIPGRVACDPFDFALSGHFHKQQSFGDGWGMYLGAPLQHNFSDVGDEGRGWWRIEFRKGSDPALEHVRSKGVPRFRSARIDLDNPKNVLAVLGADDPLRAGDYVKLTYKATHVDKAAAVVTMGPVLGALADAGIVVRTEHVPIYHHAGRIELDEKPAESPHAFVARAATAYLDGPAEIGGLDAERLQRIATTVLGEVYTEAEV